jgi:hypothetical protein
MVNVHHVVVQLCTVQVVVMHLLAINVWSGLSLAIMFVYVERVRLLIFNPRFAVLVLIQFLNVSHAQIVIPVLNVPLVLLYCLVEHLVQFAVEMVS